MMLESLFHPIFVFTFVAFMLIRMVYFRRARRLGGEFEYVEGETHQKARKLLGLPFAGLLLAFMIWPRLFDFARLPLAPWLGWLGAGLSLLMLALLTWVQWALDLNFHVILHKRSEHTLVTHGPYRWVRHPMYTVLFMHGISIFLLTGSWLVGGAYLLSAAAIVARRLRREEAMLVDEFGAAYRDYRRHTGRFLPRLWRLT